METMRDTLAAAATSMALPRKACSRMTVDSSSLAVSAVWLLYGCGFLMRRFNRWTADGGEDA